MRGESRRERKRQREREHEKKSVDNNLAPSLASLSFLPLAVHLCPFVSNKVRSTPSIFPFFFFAHLQSMDRENDGLGWDGGGLLAPNGLSLPHVVFTLFIFLIRVHPPPSSLLHYRFSFSLSLSHSLTHTRTRTRTISLSLSLLPVYTVSIVFIDAFFVSVLGIPC